MSSYQPSKSGTYRLSSSMNSSILKKCGRQSLNNVPGRKVRFDLFNNIKFMLTNYDKDKVYYNNLICDIRDSTSEIAVSLAINSIIYTFIIKLFTFYIALIFLFL